MERWDAVERQALVDALRITPPDAPTLCEGWEARHLAAHLYLRRHRPLQAFRQGPGSTFAQLAQDSVEPASYAQVVNDFAAPPPSISLKAVTDGPLGMQTNFVEYVIHHEDLRRGAGAVEPRQLPQGEQDAVFDALLTLARLRMRSLDVGVVLVVPGGRRKVVKRGEDAVAVTGAPVELALVASGRRRAADVEVTGSAEAVAVFEDAVA